MKTFNARGLVLREYEAGESDKRLLLLCKGVGRLFVYARGARRTKSKFLAAAQVFAYGDFVIAEGRGFNSLAQASLIESFYDLRSDYDALCAAYAVTEICERTVLEAQNCDELLRLTLRTLHNLSKNKIPPEQVLAVYMLKFFMWYGVMPEVTANLSGGGWVYFTAEGIVADGTPPAAHISITPPTLAALQYISANDYARAFLFNAVGEVITQLQECAELLWLHHFGTNYSSPLAITQFNKLSRR